MYKCITGASFSMKADVYIQSVSQDETTNKIIRSWSREGTINCRIVPIREVGASSKSDGKNFEEGTYREMLDVRLQTASQLSKRWRISNLRDSNGVPSHIEKDLPGSPDTIFEVFASHAVFDISGRIQYYENFLRRVVSQDNND